MEWLYDTLSEDYWSQWINTDSAKKTFKRGGYYSALVNKGLKVISLNDNACDRASFWIAYRANDIDGQLEWLIQELDESEANGRYAMIIGNHISYSTSEKINFLYPQVISRHPFVFYHGQTIISE